ncbi:MAG: LacI family DNA-binding transcriptional regulator [Chitinophagaceae bacterium]|nr:LacI family DNA-binding transcriptional regulator [Chitinophagaceae bacterium]
MKFEAVTIKDIAKALGLSTSTVSRALRDSYEISPETKKLVLEYAEKINYHPNPIALSLKERRSRTIGVMVCEIANSYFSQVINGIESIAQLHGYNVIISQSRDSAGRELQNLQYLTSRSVDGLIISVSSETKDFSYLQELHDRGMPIVFFDRIVDAIETHKVITDNFKGAYDATQHLAQMGYKRIAAICNTITLSIGKERLAGYKAALKDAGLDYKEEMVRTCEHGGMLASELEEAVASLFAASPAPDAIFAAADKLTTGCLQALRNRGLSVPGDVAMVGFSNSELTGLLNPAMSVIKQPAFEMGELATDLLLELIESKRPVTDYQTRVLGTEIIIRDSCPPVI